MTPERAETARRRLLIDGMVKIKVAGDWFPSVWQLGSVIDRVWVLVWGLIFIRYKVIRGRNELYTSLHKFELCAMPCRVYFFARQPRAIRLGLSIGDCLDACVYALTSPSHPSLEIQLYETL